MSYPLPETPILAVLPQLRTALASHRAAVLEAPPGAGKSTVVPLALLEESWLDGRRILVLQPRRIAARAVARRLAQLSGGEPGGLVGFRTRLETRVSAATRIEVVTEGILTRMLQEDPALEHVGCVIFDEFHERNLQSDLGLALTLDAQRHLREDLRLLVMSATLGGLELASLLGDAGVVRSEGRAYEVVTHHAAPPPVAVNRWPEPVEQRAARVVLQALRQDVGDVLVFLPGAAEIRRACDAIAAGSDDPMLMVLPLYGDLDAAAQDAALRPAPAGRRKVVVATNLAETSLTIEGVRVVVDAGLERRQRFDPNSGMSRLETVHISRASAEQRRGRAGRTAPGVCYRLWSESAHAALAAQSPAEMLEADLAPLALELACWGVADPASLAWLDRPPPATYAQARELLQRLEALDARGQVTAAGRRLAALGVHPRLAHMIDRGAALGLGALACRIAALLAERDPLRLPRGSRDPDLRHRLDVLQGGQAPGGATVDARALQQVRRTAELLQRRLPRVEAASPREAGAAGLDADRAAGLLLAFAYPDRIGRARGDGESGRYLLGGGRGATLPGPSALARSEFIVAADIDAGEREAQVHLAAPLERDLLERHFAASIATEEEVAWDTRTAAVVARRVRRLGSLVLEERALGAAAGERVPAAMIAGIRALGLRSLPWTKDLEQWRARVALLRAHANTPAEAAQWPDVSDEALLASLEGWLAPYLDGVTRRDHLARVDLRAALHGLLDWPTQRRLDELAPTHLVVPSGSRIALDYTAAVPALAVRLQEVFGWMDTPRVAGGRVPVTLELLSPARRPVQVTRDLASFWARGYPEVKKELKGRYPKHYWPDDPHAAVPTRKVRPPGQ
ncbi:MAG TPA: ATP-dependent helicase HrpB [Steroidobacteraceae bacterium]|nr:ATP-dependent helicase HrpB [Steroidobacteraceae bacterium]